MEIAMAYIQKAQRKKGVTYRVYIRPPGFKPITKTFTTKREAVRFVRRLDDDKRKIQAFQENKHKTLLSKIIDDYLVNGYKSQRPKEEEYRLNYWRSQTKEKANFRS